MDKRLEQSLTKNMTYSQKAMDTKKKELEMQDAYFEKHPERKHKEKNRIKKGKIGDFLMSGHILPPSELPSFNKHGRKDTVCNVHEQWEARTEEDMNNKGRVINNPIHHFFKVFGTYNDIPYELENVIHGVCNLDFYGKGMKQDIGLSKSRVFYLLQQEEVNHGMVECLYNMKKRQAQRYVQALKILIPLLEKQTHAHFIKEAQKYEKQAIRDIEHYNMEECADFNRSEYIQDVIQSMFIVLYDGQLDWDREQQCVVEGSVVQEEAIDIECFDY